MSWMVDLVHEKGGELSFCEFMELALYHPQHGYYSASEVRYGRQGDFLTAPSASQWYGAVVGRLLEGLGRRWRGLTLVDLAAGDGSFLGAVDARLAAGDQGAVQWLYGVERSPTMRRRAWERLRAAELQVVLAADLRLEKTPDPVVVHASELYDALPVHRVVARSEGLRELWVGAGESGLKWREKPAPTELAEYLERHDVRLVEGQVAELNLTAGPTHQQVLKQAGTRGLALVLDYGYEARRLYNPRGRMGGSLSCYRRHELGRDPLRDPGEQDITAHVNWDDLRCAAEAVGWEEVGLFPLAEFLVRAGLAEEAEREGLDMEAELDARVVSERQEIKRLLDPEGMGSDLKMLVQATSEMAPAVRKLLGIKNLEFRI